MNRKYPKILRNRKQRIERRLKPKNWEDQPRPMLNASNIHYEMAERTSAMNCGGIGAMHLMVQRLGLVEDINRHLHLLKVHLPYHESDHVLNLAYNLLAGEQRLEDIELRRQDEVFLNGGQGNGSSCFVEETIGPPAISIQPTSRTNRAGALTGFTVQAGGTAPLSYRWLKDGIPLSDGSNVLGSFTSTLSLSTVLMGDAAGYSVVLTNNLGSVTSPSSSAISSLYLNERLETAVNMG